MAGANAKSMDLTFSALSDPTRRAILARLASSDASVGEVAAPFDMSLPAITKHLNVLENAGLITRRREGRVRRCHLSPEPMNEAADWDFQHPRVLGGAARSPLGLPRTAAEGT